MNFRRMTSIMIAVLMITFPATLTAGESSLLLGTWSFIGDLDDHSPGSYGVLGLTSGVSDRLEVSTFMLLQMTPELLSGVHLGSGLGFSLLSPRSAAAPDTRISPFFYRYDFRWLKHRFPFPGDYHLSWE